MTRLWRTPDKRQKKEPKTADLEPDQRKTLPFTGFRDNARATGQGPALALL